MNALPRIAVALTGPAVFLVAGSVLARAFPFVRRSGFLPRLSYAFLLGASFVSTVLYAASFMGLRLGPAAVALALALATPALLLGKRRFASSAVLERARPARPRRWSILASGLIVAVFSILLLEAVSVPVSDWDGRMTWVLRSKYISHERTVLPDVLTGPALFVNHPRYPLLLPISESVGALVWNADSDDRVFRGVHPFFYLSLCFVVLDLLRRLLDDGIASLLAVTMALLPFLAVIRDGGAAGTYADVPASALWGTGCLLLFAAAAGLPRALRNGFPAGLLLCAAVLTKQEGLPFGFLAIAAAGLTAFRRAKTRPSGRTTLQTLRPTLEASVVFGLGALLSFLWQARIPDRFSHPYMAWLASGELLRGLPHKLAAVSLSTGAEMLHLPSWGVFWVLPLLVAAVRPRSCIQFPQLALAGLVACGAAVTITAYLLFPGGVEWIAMTTWNRFLLQMIVPTVMFMAFVLRDARSAP